MREYLEQIARRKIEGNNTTQYVIDTKVGSLYITVSSDNQKYYDSYFGDDFDRKKFKELTNKDLNLNNTWRIKNSKTELKELLK